MFEELCSIYEDAHDNYGRYVEVETGECIKEMSIREFCLTDRWKPCVTRLRALRKEYGDKAKKMPEYMETKKRLPGATLSGLFSLYEDESLTHPGRRIMVSRRESHLKQHTGWLAIDIDLADNRNLSDFDTVRFVCQFRPEIALLMRSCSGTGYFGLVRLAYPERHREQFRALLSEYAAIGITLDKQCGNIGRVRFASWDDAAHIYINEKVVAYQGIAEAISSPSLPIVTGVGAQRSSFLRGLSSDSREIKYLKASRLVSKIETRGIDVMGSYGDWVRCGMALHDVDAQAGYEMWKRVSRFRPADASNGHHERDFRMRWNGFANSRVKAETFFWLCKQNGVELTKEEIREIYAVRR